MSRILVDQKTCPHNEGFFCTSVTLDDGRIQNCFACVLVCGYWLAFWPEQAGSIQEEKVPKDHRIDCWKLNTLAFYPHPAPREEGWKTGGRLSTYNS